MADKTQFGNPKIPQFGDGTAGVSGDGGRCAQCEAMLADALDGALSAADQAIFDAHLAVCEPCSLMLADARRGAAWLEMLREPRPEPPAALLERILAQTTGAETYQAAAVNAGAQTAAEPVMVYAAPTGVRSNVLPFRQRVAAAVRGNFLGHAMLQPRLAMTAAMAFFSIALTLNLTGVHLTELRPADLKPSSIKRELASAKVGVVQYYEGLRVVYELESRVHDIESQSGTDSGGAPVTPAGTAPASAPEDKQGAPAKEPAPRKNPGPGSSRREALEPPARLLAGLPGGGEFEGSLFQNDVRGRRA